MKAYDIATIKETLDRAQEQLAHLDNARLEAEILLASVLEARRESFHADPDRTLPRERIIDFHNLIHHRLLGYPVAYLTGVREFWSLPFRVSRDTLIPRPETEGLVEATLARVPVGAEMDILDLGTGCGAIAVALASERPYCRVTATDLSPEALEVARHNAVQAGITDIRFMTSDWFSELGRTNFHIIVCNPPYVESDYPGLTTGEIRFEPRLALDGGPSGLRAFQQIIPAARRRLHPGGCVILEHGYQQAAAVRRLFLDNHYQDPRTLPDTAGLDRITLAVAP